ncbi:MAG: hypothetical protein R8K49_04000 [Mariprofundaceae bacterium]
MKLKSGAKALAMLAGLGLSGVAHAGDVALGAKVGTLGFGLEATTNVVPMLVNVRLQGNIFNYNKNITDTDLTYEAKLKLRSVGLLADIYPFAGKFRITGGAYYNGNKLTMTGRPTAGNITINNVNYTTAQLGTVKSTIDFNKFAPYVGIGWGDAISSGSPFGFSFELGALYMGKPKTSITATGPSAAAAAADIAVEKKKLDDSMNNMKFYPVATVGVNWRF